MTQSHLIPRPLSTNKRPDSDIQVAFAVNPTPSAILFIHGYTGGAVKTWEKFDALLPLEAKCVGIDLYFYGYDGLWADMNASAGIFRKFLGRLFGGTGQLVNASLPTFFRRTPTFSYDRFIIVAHSLGAVIARRALVDATDTGEAWVNKVKLVLFAPAHKGASVAKLAEEVAVSSIFRLFSVGARFASPLIDQLAPGSAQLTALEEDTKRLLGNGANAHLKACKVVFAEYERIVQNVRFFGDPLEDAFPNTTHTSVCKPNESFLDPLSAVVEWL